MAIALPIQMDDPPPGNRRVKESANVLGSASLVPISNYRLLQHRHSRELWIHRCLLELDRGLDLLGKLFEA
jgi:hypothetical protein